MTQQIVWQLKSICRSPISIHNFARRQGQWLKRFTRWRQTAQQRSSHATSQETMGMIQIQAMTNRATKITHWDFAKSYECDPWICKVMGTMVEKAGATVTNSATKIISLFGGTMDITTSFITSKQWQEYCCKGSMDRSVSCNESAK